MGKRITNALSVLLKTDFVPEGNFKESSSILRRMNSRVERIEICEDSLKNGLYASVSPLSFGIINNGASTRVLRILNRRRQLPAKRSGAVTLKSHSQEGTEMPLRLPYSPAITECA
ncbi:hypothetical protein CEXT_244331 [Caerostris extrusa]|uniref:Uncharacterized protein n=1 Tax=Caerostris extrusa TaxID=172846 RepID=A0AAV4T5Y0_CAEEX|nr:hypothetical protein CEXT_244331 [Caerostris extrusa]